LLDRHDSDALAIAAEIKSLLGPSNMNPSFLKLESQINSFKFEAAKDTLEQAVKDGALF